MDTIEIDRYCRTSPFFRFDPRVKLVAIISLIVTLSLIKGLMPLVIALVFIVVLQLTSRIPIKHSARIFVLSLPFIVVASGALLLTSGWMPALAMALRITSSVLALILLISTTPFFDVLWALRWFRVPYIICSLLLLTYRYIFVMMEELELMNMARRSRGFSLKGSLLSKDVFKTISFTAGMVLVRSHARSKDIYDGLVARGYHKEIRILRRPKVRPGDALLLLLFLGVIALIVSLQWGLVQWSPLS